MHVSNAHIYTQIHASHTYTHIQHSLPVYTHTAHTYNTYLHTHIYTINTHANLRVYVCAESLRSYPTLCNPMDCSPPGSSVHGDSPGKNIGVDCHALLQGSSPTQESIPHLLHCRLSSLHLSHWASPTLHVHMTYTHNTYPHTHIYNTYLCTYTRPSTHIYSTHAHTQHTQNRHTCLQHTCV